MRIGPIALTGFLFLGGCIEGWETEPWPADFAAKGCERRITEESARMIAKEAGLAPGIRPCETSFVQLPNGGFRWTVSNTSHHWNPDPDLYSASGVTISIDRTTGRVREKSDWHKTS